MINNPTNDRPFSPFGYCGSIKACNSAHGMICSISSRNCSRFDFRPYFSNPVCAARVCCRTRVFPPTYTLPAQAVDRRVFQRFPRVLLLTTCRLVAEEFHQKPEHVEITMTLVLGARDEYYAIDKTGRMTMYLEHWDEGKFVDGVIISAIQWMASLQMRNQMLTEIVRRTDLIVPVSANQLRRPTENPSLQTEGPYPACASEAGTTPCSALTRPRRR